MYLLEYARMALRALNANRLRTLLTMLGIIIGVGAVITLMAIGRGSQAQAEERVRGLGTNLLTIRPGSQAVGGVRSEAGSVATLTYEDAVAISENVPLVALVAPQVNTMAQVIAGGQNTRTQIIGTTPEYQEVRDLRVAQGDFIGAQDIQSKATVAVLGSNVSRNLFGDADPIGQTIRFNVGPGVSISFRIIGVMEAKGGTGFGSQDDLIFVPITTLQTKLAAQRTAQGSRNVSLISAEVRSEKDMDIAAQQAGELLRQRHNVVQDDFTIQSQADTLQALQDTTNTWTLFLGSVAGISLLVGGIGIMNIMLVSVMERTREIGIRKAVGARRRDILWQFLVESLVVSVVGGLLGISLGVLLSRLASGHRIAGLDMYAIVRPDSAVLAFLVAVVIGVFFGLYPALRAARLDPIEALRYE